MTSHTYVVCDAFTDVPLRGNGVAVFTEASAIPDQLLQELARELNLSETVFVYPPQAGGDARIRIFTPAKELPFAGHPTLGAAVVLGATSRAKSITLETKMGVVPVRLAWREKGRLVGWGWMSQPLPKLVPFAHVRELLDALGVAEAALPPEAYELGNINVIVGVDSVDTLSRLAPNLEALKAAHPGVAYCVAGEGTRWRARCFAPGVGVAEDPATGSAVGPFAWHLARHGRAPYGSTVEVTQGVEMGRDSLLRARVVGDADELRAVKVGGPAVIVARGTFEL